MEFIVVAQMMHDGAAVRRNTRPRPHGSQPVLKWITERLRDINTWCSFLLKSLFKRVGKYLRSKHNTPLSK